MSDWTDRYGRTALVTGASSGIGAAFARELARRRMDLVIVARRTDRLEEMKKELEAACGVKVFAFSADLAEAGASAKIEAELKRLGLQIDLLVANAGFGKWGDFGSYDLQIDLDMVQVNCASVVDLTHRLLPPMKARKRGGAIIVSSVLGRIPAPWMAVYSATKAFDKYFAESLYTECKRFGVAVLAIEPTMTSTEFRAGAGQSKQKYKVRTSEQVVATALAALGRRPSVTDSFIARRLAQLADMAPRKLVLKAYEILRGPDY